MKRQTAIGGLLLLVILSALAGGCRKPASRLTLGGGPGGGTFQNIALGLAKLINREMPDVRVRAEHTGGSVDNLIRVDRGSIPMALVYAGDAYLGENGKLREGEKATVNVRALAQLYGAAAQLVVSQSSSAQAPHDLRRSRIAIGNPGSGSALAARRFFGSLGIWEDVIPIYTGFDVALEELRRGEVEAVWLLVGFPNRSLQKFAREVPIRFLDLNGGAATRPFFDTYPFYTAARIPAGTYYGQERDVTTFQDNVLWVANRKVDDAFVYRALKVLYSERGLALMRSVDPAVSDMSEKKGVAGVTIPLHPGAEWFWRERGALPQRRSAPPLP